MAQDFSLLSMTELRTRPGEILDRVAEGGEAFIIERNGQRSACLVPLSVFFPDIPPARIAFELKELEDHGEEPRPTITEERELVFRFNEAIGTDTAVKLSIILPHGYPNKCPRVYADPVSEKAPHRWADGALCIYGVMMGWNPGKSTVFSTLGAARQWLRNYNGWLTLGEWPKTKESSND